MERLAHVLIVDDDEVSNFISEQKLNEALEIGRLSVKQNGQEAIKYLNECSRDYPDIIFLDLNMPLMNGFEFLEYYQKSDHLGKTKIVVLSSSDQETDRDKALGFNDVIEYIEKPLTGNKIHKLATKL
ncbi:MAG: response regulator [Bacteroidota bacterium]